MQPTESGHLVTAIYSADDISVGIDPFSIKTSYPIATLCHDIAGVTNKSFLLYGVTDVSLIRKLKRS